MSIWFCDYTLDDANALSHGNLGEHLEIVFTAMGEDSLTAQMPVDNRTVQPAGWLHGGASAALAEHVGSIAANLCVDPQRSFCVGQEISASHLRPVQGGQVCATARPLRIGRTSQVWEIRIENGAGKTVCVSRLTMAVVKKRH